MKRRGFAALVLAMATLGACAQQPADDAPDAAPKYPPQGRFLTVNGHRVHYVEKGSGPALVLIHGASGSLRDWTFGAVDRLARRYRVIAFDRPGLGYTPRIDRDGASIFEQADLFVAAAAQLDAPRPIVLGHSYGGAVALAWAVEHPDAVSGLVLVSAASQTWDTGLPLFYRVTSGPLGALANPAIAALAGQDRVQQAIASVFAPQPVPPGYAAHIGAELALRPDSLRENALQRAALKSGIARMVPRYPTMDVPVELLHGDADSTVGLQIHSVPTARQIPGANLVVLPGVGHAAQHVAAAQMDAAIDRVARRAGLR
ncbi:alpha/beta hydrolase [Salipiger aestuarii]|uniref:Pimeloyl-ACP methyl ester carboxylesterase n=1 Tax=Salipiger aestuarii TaxID=568098 RepID=A0A327YYM3_9RHOB|nr:alpha/beta hydrolase [Salipiger aestuarii]EIE50675.1 alpha/beta hydrolase [Citreicella sp. 357]KAA8607319.1 alpha/beta hydrolase [Salipiger aestuarii]KAA8612988.1 alpha/beta hydrolase [Salipiger aestuarii]KAB2543767.1 alpha/beta hydrolase [Salipiger aestuarii]RAK23019.1 pimeloyl-ACP methyl ester carboxylesterase [Salipiger aestuarii]